jgi:PilZ domain
MDNRRHPRLYMQLPIRFVVEQPEMRDSQAGQGMLKNISYGGILFLVEPPLSVKRGQVREFSFYLLPEKRKQCDLTHLQARGLVRRIERPDSNSSGYGVAVQFLSAIRMKHVPLNLTISSRRRV